MKLKKIFGIINLCFLPFCIISPVPIFAITLFFISSNFHDFNISKLNILFSGILISIISCSASNFWNHVNDINEDKKNHKNTLLTNNTIKFNEALLISFTLYFISFIFVIYESITLNRPIFIYFSVWAFITWWYSDDIFLKKITGIRLKTHYLGEILTYSIAYPAFTMSIWLIFSDSTFHGFMICLITFCFGLAGVLLKDLKDIKGDREAGLRTLGVVFLPSKLIKTSCIFLILYFLTIILAIKLDVFNIKTLIILIPFIYFLKYTFFYFESKNWILEFGDHKNIKSMVFSTYFSFIMLGVMNFI